MSNHKMSKEKTSKQCAMTNNGTVKDKRRFASEASTEQTLGRARRSFQCFVSFLRDTSNLLNPLTFRNSTFCHSAFHTPLVYTHVMKLTNLQTNKYNNNLRQEVKV